MIEHLYQFIQTSRATFFLVLLAGLLASIEGGRWMGIRRRNSIGEHSDEGANLVVGIGAGSAMTTRGPILSFSSCQLRASAICAAFVAP